MIRNKNLACDDSEGVRDTKERRATCQSLISDLSGVESSPARNKCTSQDAQKQLRPRRVDGRTRQSAVYSD